ncbi:unnamed protein product [Nezara viridula]|uniref:LRRCT domain-containing protein n=1 Tax=Nezara viridula TaxID=85310 RepID=A0A9P0MV99_NEZVI|nr:unnamed protein product [Nezara viridula]
MDDGAGFTHLWLVLLLLAPARCICPSKCTCRDDALAASCVGAGLAVVPIQLNPDLEVIELQENRIANVDYTLTFYTSLRKLDVSNNKINSLKAHNFENQGKLLSLNASYNNITTLSKDAFKGLKLLRNLDLSHNNIMNVEPGSFHDTANLQTINLSYNRITSFLDPTVFKPISSLRVLNLHNNEILDIPSVLIKNLPSPCVLETLTLSNNLIEIIEEKSFLAPCSHSIKTLTLGSNVIKDIEKAAFNALYNLEYVDLSFNNLTYIPTMQLSKLSKLRELDLSGNRFTEVRPVAFQSLFQLRILKLNRLWHLNKIDSRAFVDNIRLESLHVEENELLTRIPPRIFHGNPQLMHVSLRGNSLTTADVSHFPLDRLRSLDLSGNPLHCNCSLHWLWTLVQMEIKLVEPTSAPSNDTSETSDVQLRVVSRNLKCESPESLRGQLMSEIPESTVSCETTWMTVAIITALVLALSGGTCVFLLLFGTDRRLCGCRRSGKQENDPVAGDTRRLAPGLHGPSGPILMLMPDKHYRDAIMSGYMKASEDTKVVEPWMDQPASEFDSNQAKKPHIVYV